MSNMFKTNKTKKFSLASDFDIGWYQVSGVISMRGSQSLLIQVQGLFTVVRATTRTRRFLES